MRHSLYNGATVRCGAIEIADGGWLNIAEIELGAMTKQCLDRRVPRLWIYVPNCANGNQYATKSKKVLIGSLQPMMQESS
jgi:hypothetical protein